MSSQIKVFSISLVNSGQFPSPSPEMPPSGAQIISQFSLLIINSYGFWWTISIIFNSESISNNYISYIIAVIILNLLEFIATIYTAIQTRKGIHVEWWFYGGLTNILCKSKS